MLSCLPLKVRVAVNRRKTTVYPGVRQRFSVLAKYLCCSFWCSVFSCGGAFQCSQKWGVIKLRHSGKIVLLAWWLKKGGRKKKQWRINRKEVKEKQKEGGCWKRDCRFYQNLQQMFPLLTSVSPPRTTSHLPNSYITASLSPACAVYGWTGCRSLHFLTTDLLSVWEQASSLMDRGRL